MPNRWGLRNPDIDNLSVFSANYSPALFQDRDKSVTDFSRPVKQFSPAQFSRGHSGHDPSHSVETLLERLRK
jgi:hypothetical protein